jgi:hypothetical protein
MIIRIHDKVKPSYPKQFVRDGASDLTLPTSMGHSTTLHPEHLKVNQGHLSFLVETTGPSSEHKVPLPFYE